MKFLDQNQRNQIGISYIMDNLEITTTYGMDYCKHIKPFTEKTLLEKEFENLAIMIEAKKNNVAIFDELGYLFCKIKDIRKILKRLERKETLDEVELFEIKNFSILSNQVKHLVDLLKLEIKELELAPLDEIIKLLDPQDTGHTTFYIYDEYSQRLKDIRKEKRKIEKMIYAVADEDQQAWRDKRLEWVVSENEEMLIICEELSASIVEYVSFLRQNTEVMGRLDFLIAKALMAVKTKATRPLLVDDKVMSLEAAVHPEVQQILSKKGKLFTPISIELKKGTTIITGANMGGKSVALKTLVLNLMLAHLGFYAFAERLTTPLFEFIYFISDDMQSVSKGLSTFGAEIIKLKEVVESAKLFNGFIALDEFARGTNPKEGFYLVKSLAAYLNDFESISLISTHYDGVVGLGMDHYQVMGLKHVDFTKLKQKICLNKGHSVDIIQEHMDYRLEKVCKNSSVPKDALNIAMLLGLEEKIVDIARIFYDSEE